MNNKHSSHPLICIDFKKNRIRIHRNTLRQIGNPEYIQLLVNPDQKMIGIKASCAEDKLAHIRHRVVFLCRRYLQIPCSY